MNNKINSQQYNTFTPQYQNSPFFSTIQPQGIIYLLNNSNELNNLLNSTGNFAAFCFSENIVYVRLFYNGNYVLNSYKLVSDTEDQQENPLANIITQLDQRITRLEKSIKKEANLNELI